jgi:hypothetical protein
MGLLPSKVLGFASVCTSVLEPGQEFRETAIGNCQNIVIASEPTAHVFPIFYDGVIPIDLHPIK